MNSKLSETKIIDPIKIESQENLENISKRLPFDQFDNPFLFVRTGLISKLLFLNNLVKRTVSVPGDFFEFGIWKGQNLILFENLRAINDHFNFSRTIYGFDTFDGYNESSGLKIPQSEISKYVTEEGWEHELRTIFNAHRGINHSSSKLEIIKGDVRDTCQSFFKKYNNLIALAYIDIATRDTTEAVLQSIVKRLAVGGIVVIDDFGPQYAGVSEAISKFNWSNFKLELSETYAGKLLISRLT